MSRSQQPDRVRILSSGSMAPVPVRRRGDRELDVDDLEYIEADEDDLVALSPATVPHVPLAPVALSPMRLVSLFLCCSALGGACAVASGLIGAATR